MRPARVVETEIARQRGLHSAHRLVGVEVEVLVLDTSPQPLDEHIVDPTPLAVHAHLHALGQEHRGEVLGGELGALGSANRRPLQRALEVAPILRTGVDRFKV